jgi:hypothetical protein
VLVDLDEVRSTLRSPGPPDHADWRRIRELLAQTVGECTFDIWLEPLELVAIDNNGVLIASAPSELRGWIEERLWHLAAGCAARVERELRLADEAQLAAMRAAAPALSVAPYRSASVPSTPASVTKR